MKLTSFDTEGVVLKSK